MASLTIKNIPDELLEQLRQKAAADRRSLNQQILRLLERALVVGEMLDQRQLRSEIEAQASKWEALAGKWGTAEPAEQEIARIYATRSKGRKVNV